jgi:hypothetical protein
MTARRLPEVGGAMEEKARLTHDRLREFAARVRCARLTGDGREVILSLGLIEAEHLEVACLAGAQSAAFYGQLAGHMGVE